MTDATVNESAIDRRARHRAIAIYAGGFLAVAILAWGVHWWRTGRFIVATDDAYARADIVTVAPRVPGYLVEVDVHDNQPVKAGDVLARLDDRDYKARVEQAEAALASAEAEARGQEARIANLDARHRQQQSLVDEAVANLTAASAERERAAAEDRRQATLVAQQVSSERQREVALADTRRAGAGEASARAALEARRQALPVLDTERASAEAEHAKALAALAGAKARLTLATLDLEHSVIRAPLDGTVGQRSLRTGQYVDVGTPLLAVVPNERYVIANFKETQVERMKPGQPAHVDVDAYGGLSVSGHVDSFAPASGAQFALLPPDNATGNFTKIVQRMPVRIRLDASRETLAGIRPGMSVIATVDTHDE